jgi:hypothetical protein
MIPYFFVSVSFEIVSKTGFFPSFFESIAAGVRADLRLKFFLVRVIYYPQMGGKICDILYYLD